MCEGRRLDHLTLAPHLECRGFFEQVLHAYFFVLLCIGAQPWLVRTPFRMSYLGMGAFNMVRRAAYDRVGGHAAIRLDVLDDVKLGKLIKLNGLRQDALDANGGLRVQWQESFFGVIRGLEKNGFAIFDYSLVKLFAYSAIVVLFQLFPYAAIVIWPDSRGGGWLASLAVPPFGDCSDRPTLGILVHRFARAACRYLRVALYDVAVSLFDAVATGCPLARYLLSAEPAPRERLLNFGDFS